MKELLEAGVHFGHQTKRWNPKMKPYIFGERNSIYIIDLQKTLYLFKEAAQFVTELASQGKTFLFVGTKRQAQDAIAEESARCNMFYVNQRWLGGLLTNFTTIQKSVRRLKDLEAMKADGRYELLPKKEVMRLERQRKALDKNLSGIKDMPHLPDAIFVVDSNREEIAVSEARRLNIPIMAVVDTNCNPELIDYVIPGNDDALRAIRLFASRIADAVLEGQGIAAKAEEAKAEPPAESLMDAQTEPEARTLESRTVIATEGEKKAAAPSDVESPPASTETSEGTAPLSEPVESAEIDPSSKSTADQSVETTDETTATR
jgi:small subunit ribosomal protein S2